MVSCWVVENILYSGELFLWEWPLSSIYLVVCWLELLVDMNHDHEMMPILWLTTERLHNLIMSIILANCKCIPKTHAIYKWHRLSLKHVRSVHAPNHLTLRLHDVYKFTGGLPCIFHIETKVRYVSSLGRFSNYIHHSCENNSHHSGKELTLWINWLEVMTFSLKRKIMISSTIGFRHDWAGQSFYCQYCWLDNRNKIGKNKIFHLE